MAMPEPCPRPNGSQLDKPKLDVLRTILNFVKDQNFNWDTIQTRRLEFVGLINATCKSDDDIVTWFSEVNLWVRWFNNYGYHLAFFLSDVALARPSILYAQCLDLLADAQCSVAEDLALDSLEGAYRFLLLNRMGFGDAFPARETYHRRKLQMCHDYLYRYAKPFGYIGSLPLTDHLYFALTALWLGWQFPDGLETAIEKSASPDLVYYQVLAHRHLGIALSLKQDLQAGTEQFRLGLELANNIHLETEIPHLHRLYGYNLRLLGVLDESEKQLRQACELETKSGSSTYWIALSYRELADTLLAKPDDATKRDAFISTSSDARMAFDAHLGMCPIPIARNAKQQLFRAFSERAVDYFRPAALARDLLSEIEASGPREATDVALEISAARRVAPATLAAYRRDRGLYYETLSTVSPDFDLYLDDVKTRFTERHSYLLSRRLLSPDFAVSNFSTAAATAVLDLNLPGVCLLLFHLGQFQSTAVLIDSTTRHITTKPLPFTTAAVYQIHEEYLAAAGPGDKQNAALATMLTRYEELLGAYFRGIQPIVKGKHLKIFPRLEMNALPFHALKIDGEYLIDTCDISYGQTLGLFLENHTSESTQQGTALRMVLGDGVPWYKSMSPKIEQAYGASYREDAQVTWPQLMASLSGQPARDNVFACHGEFDPHDIAGSYLRLTDQTDGSVSFAQVFAELDLRGCRSVMMGACESGLVRASISAEYIGLPSAMLASGVRYVSGALWRIPEVATAVMVDRYLELLRDPKTGVCAALCRAQRDLMCMTRDELSAWIRDVMKSHPQLEAVLKDVARLDPVPYAHPYFWAGMTVVGDV